MGAGYPINWALPVGSSLETHPLYIKYSSTEIGQISGTEVRQTLEGILPRKETAEVIAYLSWLVRLVKLLEEG